MGILRTDAICDRDLPVCTRGKRDLGTLLVGQLFMSKAAAVVRLLCACCPSPVVRAIASLVIRPIEREAVRDSLTDVCDEVFERVPALANSDAATAVVFPVRMLAVMTALHDVAP